MKELMSLKESILISQINKAICNGCDDLSIVVYDLNDFMILNIKDIGYRCYVFYNE